MFKYPLVEWLYSGGFEEFLTRETIELLSARLCGTAYNSALLPSHELRVDAMRRILFAYGPGVSIHFRTETGEVADWFRLEFAGYCNPDVCVVERIGQQPRRYNAVRSNLR